MEINIQKFAELALLWLPQYICFYRRAFALCVGR